MDAYGKLIQTYTFHINHQLVPALWPLLYWLLRRSGPVAQRITRLTTDQKIAGSNPAWIETFSLQ